MAEAISDILPDCNIDQPVDSIETFQGIFVDTVGLHDEITPTDRKILVIGHPDITTEIIRAANEQKVEIVVIDKRPDVFENRPNIKSTMPIFNMPVFETYQKTLPETKKWFTHYDNKRKKRK